MLILLVWTRRRIDVIQARICGNRARIAVKGIWEQVGFGISPPARWGLLDFIRAVLPPPPPPPPPVSPRPCLHQLPRPLPPCQLVANLFANFRAQWALLDLNCRLRPCQLVANLFANFRAQWAPLDLNCRLPIWVGKAGPQLQGSERSGHRWTSIRDLPSPVGTAGPQPGTFRAQRAPLDLNGQIECLKICQLEWMLICLPKDMPDKMPEDMPARMSSDMPDRMLQGMPDKVQKICQIECQIGCQKICQKICQIECQKICQ